MQYKFTTPFVFALVSQVKSTISIPAPIPVPDNPVVTHNGNCPNGNVASAPPSNFYNYSIDTVTPFQNPPILASADFCVSSDTESCGNTQTFTYTVTTGWTVEANVAPQIGPLKDIFTGTLTVGGSYTTMYGSGTGTGTTTNCPLGGVHCGVQVVPSMVWFSGTIWQWQNYCDETTFVLSGAYNITTPVLINISGQGNKAEETFSTCYLNTNGWPVPNDAAVPVCPDTNVVPLVPQCDNCLPGAVAT